MSKEKCDIVILTKGEEFVTLITSPGNTLANQDFIINRGLYGDGANVAVYSTDTWTGVEIWNKEIDKLKAAGYKAVTRDASIDIDVYNATRDKLLDLIEMSADCDFPIVNIVQESWAIFHRNGFITKSRMEICNDTYKAIKEAQAA